MNFSVKGILVATVVFAVALRAQQASLSWLEATLVVANLLALTYSVRDTLSDCLVVTSGKSMRQQLRVVWVPNLVPDLVLVAASIYAISNVLVGANSYDRFSFPLLAASTIAMVPANCTGGKVGI